jgi:ACS family hexuronate transporter-like MFS transporter
MSSPTPTFFDRHWRWFVLGTMFLATFLNYLDRQTLSVAVEPICKEFGLDNADRGRLLAAFIYSYALSHLFVGFIIDRTRNIRRLFPVIVMGWAVCNLLVCIVHNYSTLLWLRVFVGIFESANFPLCLMLVARIFPARERAFASGVFYSGAVIATLVAPKFVIYLSTTFNWRWGFFATGALALCWAVPWLLVFRQPERRALNWPREASAPEPAPARPALADILRRPVFWGVVLVGMGIIPGLYFMTQWLPSYLTEAWHVKYNQMLGNRLVLVSFCQDLGMWLGGAVVWGMANRGVAILTARKSVIAVAYLMMMGILVLPRVTSVDAAVVLLCVYIFGLGAWLANQQAFKQEVARGREATVGGLVGFAETIVAAFVVQKVGALVQETGGFNAVFLLFGGLFTFALLMVFVFLRPCWVDIK